METEKNSLSFGRYLQSVRLEKKISLEKVAEETRIGVANLLLIEQEDHEQLPAEVFVKGFLRAYAKAIGADPDEAVRRYESRLDMVQKIAVTEAQTKNANPRPWRRLIVSLGALTCLILLTIFAVNYFRGLGSSHESVTPQDSSMDQPEIESASRPKSEVTPTATSAGEPEMLILKVTAQEDASMKVIIDEGDPTEYKLKPGDHIELQAKSSYNLLIGNAGGVKMKLNDKPITVPGRSGEVVNLHIP